MSLLVKRNSSALPSLVSDFFSTDRLFNRSLLDFESDLLNRDMALVIPEVNIIENGKDYQIELAAPGLDKKDFKIEVKDNILTVSAEKEEEKKEENKNYKRREFSYNSFCRSFTLPENSISDKIDAKYEKGVLHLSLPKKEVTMSKPAKQIKVA